MGGIFKAYDIRGSYPDELDEGIAGKIGAAFVSLLKARRIVVGRDMRLSAQALAQAFIGGATSSGASVADIGVAFDGDADRCGFIDEKGERIPEDLVTALIAEFLLKKEPGATILHDLRSSRVVPETITRLGGRAVRCRVGHAFINEQMREENALFAGELSGHYYYRDMGFTDNAVFTMIQMLNFLSLKMTPLSRVIRTLKKYYSTGEINMKVNAKESVFAALGAQYKDARKDHLDGLTVEYDAWWFNLRASNTEPVMRLNLEAENENMMEVRKEEILRIIGTTDPSMTIKD